MTRAACAELDENLVAILSHAGLPPEMYRPTSLERRIPACLRALRASSLAQAQQQVQRHPELAMTAIDALLLGVTSFFRDPEVFDRLENQILPQWHIAQMRANGLRVVSVGCSDGHELYSTAIVLHRLRMWPPAQLLGIDCRPRAIARARRGEYSPGDVQNMTPERRCYFETFNDRVRVKEPLRTMTQWQSGDLGKLQEHSFDIVLFRNVAIYFQTATGERIWERISNLLNPGGLLITGKAERPTAGLPLRRLHACVYQKSMNL